MPNSDAIDLLAIPSHLTIPNERAMEGEGGGDQERDRDRDRDRDHHQYDPLLLDIEGYFDESSPSSSSSSIGSPRQSAATSPSSLPHSQLTTFTPLTAFGVDKYQMLCLLMGADYLINMAATDRVAFIESISEQKWFTIYTCFSLVQGFNNLLDIRTLLLTTLDNDHTSTNHINNN